MEVLLFTALMVIIHLILCLTLIVLVLLHSGSGGGISAAFGGGMSSSFGGSQIVKRNLDRITIVSAVLFSVTTIVLIYLFD